MIFTTLYLYLIREIFQLFDLTIQTVFACLALVDTDCCCVSAVQVETVTPLCNVKVRTKNDT